MTEAAPGTVLFDLWLTARAATALLDDALRPSGLVADEFAIYSMLAAPPAEGLTPSDLARWMTAPPTTVSSYIQRFERRGHVMRLPNPEDGRSYRVRLTEAGLAAYRAAGALFEPVVAAVEGRLGAALPDTRRHLAALRTSLQENPREA